MKFRSLILAICITYICIACIRPFAENFTSRPSVYSQEINDYLIEKRKLPGYLNGYKSIKYKGSICNVNEDKEIKCDGAGAAGSFKFAPRGSTRENVLGRIPIDDSYSIYSDKTKKYCGVDANDNENAKQYFMIEDTEDGYRIKQDNKGLSVDGAYKIDVSEDPDVFFSIE